MDLRRQHTDIEPAVSSAHRGLEVEAYQGLEMQPHSAQVLPQIVNTQQHQLSHPGVSKSGETNIPKVTTDKRRRIFGLTTPIFWGLLVALVLLIAAAIGGGIGGGLASQQHGGGTNSDDDDARAGPTASRWR
ncbi:uncharacterized protein PG986_009967 [Apiospora aurea]|uniref:Uncharacterized protein n=1 Tax=Apiospora aurea TaxID=335848 RepID=A0ABR1Q967_9PEZI